MVVSYDLLHELETVLLRDKFRKKLTVADVLSYVEFLHERATIVSPSGGQYALGELDLPDPDDQYLVQLAHDAQADCIVSGDPHFRDLPQAHPPSEFVTAHVTELYEKLTTQIPEFYGAYFSELRNQLERPDVFAEAVPNWMRGYKRVVTVGVRDGVVVVHFPRELEVTVEGDDGTTLHRFPSEPDAVDHAYEFLTFQEESASALANFIGGGADIEIDIEPGVAWGIKGYVKPQQIADTSGEIAELSWQAPWTRLVAADHFSLIYFSDPETAEEEARRDAEPYIQRGEPS
jgi:putative PIN family toxin of toxin-antitoxin system